MCGNNISEGDNPISYICSNSMFRGGNGGKVRVQAVLRIFFLVAKQRKHACFNEVRIPEVWISHSQPVEIKFSASWKHTAHVTMHAPQSLAHPRKSEIRVVSDWRRAH